jgi:hypothetical protein
MSKKDMEELKRINVNKLLEIRRTNLPKTPGVYIVCWVKGGNRVTIPRFLRDDKSGILYVGSAENLARRLTSLRNYILDAFRTARGEKSRYKEIKHTLALSLLYTNLVKVLSEEELLIYYKTFESVDEARDQEALILYEYTKYYGEPPPLNLKIGRQYLMILGLGKLKRSKLVGELDPELALLIDLVNK